MFVNIHDCDIPKQDPVCLPGDEGHPSLTSVVKRPGGLEDEVTELKRRWNFRICFDMREVIIY